MLLPIGFDAPKSRQPYATYALVALCTVIWLLARDPYAEPWSGRLVAWCGDVESYKKEMGAELDRIEKQYPSQTRVDIRRERAALKSIVHWTRRPWTLLTCAFLHADVLHLLGNMAFLFIFGRAVNGWLGTLRYLLLYLFLAVFATLGHILFSGSNVSGLVGASGAIAGVMGLAAALFPRQRVRFLFMFYFRFGTFQARAFWALVLWFGWDLVQALLLSPGGGGGVAFMAHVMGFAGGLGAGIILLKTGQAESHDGDILGWFSGRAERRQRKRNLEYIAEVEAANRPAAGAPGGAQTLDDFLGAGRPNRSKTASFDSFDPPRTRSKTARFEASALPTNPRELAAGACELLLAARLDPSRRAEALAAYRRVVERFPAEQLPPAAERAGAELAHLARQPDIEVIAAERLARRFPGDPDAPQIVRRAARVCREGLEDVERAERLMELMNR